MAISLMLSLATRILFLLMVNLTQSIHQWYLVLTCRSQTGSKNNKA
jgi:hypothetical protein